MNPAPPPLLRSEKRTAAEIAAGVAERLGLRGAGADSLRGALVGIFARYCEILVERLNRVPEVHRIAFLDLLGISRTPAVPAWTTLAFRPVPGGPRGIRPLVPRHTQVAAPAQGPDPEPVLFETLRDLELVRAELARAVLVDFDRQSVVEAASILAATGMCEESPTLRATGLRRAMHIAQPAIFGAANLTELRLEAEVDGAATLPADAITEWGITTPEAFVPLVPQSDTTLGLRRSGEVAFRDLPDWPAHQIAGNETRWLTCRLLTDDRSRSRSAAGDMGQSARIRRLRITGRCGVQAVPVEQALFGGVPLDATREFYPLGERPRFGDVFYLRSQAFAIVGARTLVDIKLVNPAGAEHSPIPVVSQDGNPLLLWETYTVEGWKALRREDGTHFLTRDGVLAFTVPPGALPVAVGGVQGGWLRVRLVSGNYAAGARSATGVAVVPMAPPAIARVAVTTTVTLGPMDAAQIVVESNLELTPLDQTPPQPFVPFPAADVQDAALYVGLLAAEMEVSGRTLSFYVKTAPPGTRVHSRDAPEPDARPPRWQVRVPGGWRDCVVQDETHGIRYPGIVTVRLPDEASRWSGSTLDPAQLLYWLRIVSGSRSPGETTRIRQLVLNAVPARQATRLENELLGSSNGRPDQQFRTARASIIGRVTLEVQEPATGSEALPVAAGSAPAALVPRSPFSAQAEAPWIPWSCVEDLASSAPRSRHFTLDRSIGIIRFGDAMHGLIPPPGPNNVRLREYHSGGGSRGNLPLRVIAQLRTTIPYVESVTNCEPATGGQDAESPESLYRSGSAWLRHRDRAVCADDYADLARKASPEVARAICVAVRDLARDAEGLEAAPGVVSVIVVPEDPIRRPQPSLALVRHVKAFLDARRPVGVDVVVLGPEYVRVCVEVELACIPGVAGARVARECETRLDVFLHPVTGGQDGRGWEFGQRPHASDFYPLLEAIDGVDHIRSLRLRIDEESAGLLAGRGHLVSAGAHEVRVT